MNYLLTSHVWRQDHNGFSHQDPGFIDYVCNKKADVVRVYLPPDANCLLWVTDHCLRSWDRINVIVAGKQPSPQWLDIDAAVKHCDAGIGIWEWASNDRGAEPDVVMACAGDVPTMETLAAVDLLHHHVPDLKIRVINVVDLMTLQPHEEHPHGLTNHDFDALFTTDKPVIFAHHGYPWLIHRLTYRRTNHHNIHVRGYKEEGTTTTPFDMVVRNDLDRFHLASDVIDRLPKLGYMAAYAKQALRDKLIEHKEYITRHGDDMPEVKNWRWPGGGRLRRAGKCERPVEVLHPTCRLPAVRALFISWTFLQATRLAHQEVPMAAKIVVGIFESEGIAEDARHRLRSEGIPNGDIALKILKEIGPIPSTMEPSSRLPSSGR